MSATQWTTLVFLGAVWGSSFFFAKLALVDVTPLAIVAARIVIAAVLLNALLPAIGQYLPRDWKHWRAFFVMGVLNNLVPFMLIFWAQYHIPSGLAATLNSTTPIFSVVLAHFLVNERLTGARIFGALAGFLGVALMVGPEALGGKSDTVLAQLAVVLAALCYAANAFYARRVSDVPPLASAAGMVTATAVLAVPLELLIDKPWTKPLPGLTTYLALVSLGVLSTALAYVLYFRLLQTAGPSNVMLVTFLIPVSALLLGVIVLHETLKANQTAGMALIALGLVIIDGRVLKRAWPPSSAP
jgi:drug/metabolite transporter (DMT)-like permease